MLTLVRDPELGPCKCPTCGRAIVWALTDRDERVALEQLPPDPFGRPSNGAGAWVVGLEGETLRCRPAELAGGPRWAQHRPFCWPGATAAASSTVVLAIVPGGKAPRR